MKLIFQLKKCNLFLSLLFFPFSLLLYDRIFVIILALNFMVHDGVRNHQYLKHSLVRGVLLDYF